ncbi:MAG: hypothetical protein AAFQ95_25445 [Cyanobacteria bacterium J06621_3]
MTEQLATLIRQAEALPVTEQLALIAHLAQKLKSASVSAGPKTENTGDTPAHTEKTLLQLADDFATDLSDETLAQLPRDGAVEHDHYIYGTPKIHS